MHVGEYEKEKITGRGSTSDKFRQSATNKISPSKTKQKFVNKGNLYNQKNMTDRDKEQLFLNYYDENLKLKENHTKLEQHLKE